MALHTLIRKPSEYVIEKIYFLSYHQKLPKSCILLRVIQAFDSEEATGWL